MNLLVTMSSSDAMPPRAPLSVHIVLDVSGSMTGQAIDDAKSAAEAAVDKLDPTDDFSMVTFSDTASVIVPDGPIGPRRGQVVARIRGVQAGGGTNIWAGLDLGYNEARASRVGDDAVRLVMLLSDGHANGGDTDPAAPRRARRAGVPGRRPDERVRPGPRLRRAPHERHRRPRRGRLLLRRRLVADRARPRPRDRRAPPARRDGRRTPRPPPAGHRRDARLRVARALGHRGRRRARAGGRRRPAGEAPRHRGRPPDRRCRRDALLHPRLRARRPPRDDDHACSSRPAPASAASRASRSATRTGSSRRT